MLPRTPEVLRCLAETMIAASGGNPEHLHLMVTKAELEALSAAGLVERIQPPGGIGSPRTHAFGLKLNLKMEATVIDINANKPHWTGPVTCSACGCEWQAVAPEGTDLCECPSCGCMAGVRFSPRELTLIRALEKVKTGYALGENSRINWDIAKGVAGETLASVGWPVTQ